MGAPQGIFLVLVGLTLFAHFAKHGEPRAPYSAGVALLNAAITLGLLWWGGFFS